MKSQRSNETYTLEEILTLTDVELVSNWTKLTSLIRAYEKTDWEKSKKKALELRNEGTAFDYIKTVRAFPDGNIPKTEEPPLKKEYVKQSKPPKVKSDFKTPLTIFDKNYNRLLLIVPDLEEKLAHFDPKKGDFELVGKSISSGFMDFNFELIHFDNTGYYFAMSHYFKQNGDMVPDPDMLVLVDLKNRTLQALHFQNQMYYRQVYEDVYNRKLINLKEKDAQNAFLTTWLRNLKNQHHKIEWKDDDDDFVPTSVIVDEYQKEESDNQEKSLPKKESTTKNESPENVEAQPEPAKGEIEKVEVIESAKTTKMAIEFSVKQRTKLPAIILLLEGIKEKTAEIRAGEMIENGKALDFLINGYDRVKNEKLRALLEINYYKMQYVVPKIYLQKGSPQNTLLLAPTVSGIIKTYYFSDVTQLKKNKEFAIYESATKTHLGGSLNIGFSDQQRYAWVSLLAKGFDGHEDFLNEEPLVYSDKRYQVNVEFGKWLDYVLSKKYEYMWLSKDLKEPLNYIDEDEAKPVIPKTETSVAEIPVTESKKVEPPVVETPVEEPPKVEEVPTEKSYDPNEGIPDFEIGQVKLTEQHKKHGLTQRDINWINRHKQGMTIVPRTKVMVHNTKNVSMDMAIKAKQPGYRISVRGKFYYEGRSNRSDRTVQGL